MGIDRGGIYRRKNLYWFPHWPTAYGTYADFVCVRVYVGESERQRERDREKLSEVTKSLKRNPAC